METVNPIPEIAEIPNTWRKFEPFGNLETLKRTAAKVKNDTPTIFPTTNPATTPLVTPDDAASDKES